MPHKTIRLFIVLISLIGISVSLLLFNRGVSPALAQSCPEVQNTPYFTLVWGTVQWNGQPAPAGTVVTAKTPAARGGDTVGCFVVTSQGDYGLMFVYGEDTSVSPAIPGMQSAEIIEFFVDGMLATATPTQTWSNDKDVHQVNLSATGAPSPVASFSGSPTSGVAPLAVQFTDASTGTITSRLWNFGDGITSTQTSPSHTYNSAGVYTVVLTVSGPGGSDVMTRTNYINVGTTPTAPVTSFSGTPTSGTAPLAVQFTDASTGQITSWQWNFGDGATSIQTSPSHTYSSAGVYTVVLTVSGPGGSDVMTRTNYINVSTTPASPTAAFSGTPPSGVAPLAVQFTDASTGQITSRQWNFGDGATSTQTSPNHTYTSAGVYTVILTVSGPGGSNTITKTDYITVNSSNGITANFSGSPTSGTPPLTVNFSDQSSGTVNLYFWEFGDGTYSTLQHPSHTYPQPGVYTVTLTVSGSAGNDNIVKTNYITVYTPTTANFSATPTSGVPPLAVQFTDQSTGNINFRLWNFGDGAYSALTNPSHTYTGVGVYTVTLTVNGIGGSDVMTRSNYINVSTTPTAPVAGFSGIPTSGTAPLAVQFTDTSTGQIASRQWAFGDGATSTQTSPSHTYTNAGVYTVTLTVNGTGGSDTITKTNYITVNASADFDADGVDDSVEDNAPNGGDGNEDGAPDKQQANVVSFPDAVNGDYLTLIGPAHSVLNNVRAISVPAGAPSGVVFPQGFVEFEVGGLSTGEAITVTMIMHGGDQPNVYWKFGKTAGTPAIHWYKFNYDNITGATFAGNSVILHFVDGQRGDDDLSANGRIFEPGGAGIQSSHVYLPVVLK